MRILSTDELSSDAFAIHWNTLLKECPPHDLGQTCAWNQCWWKYFGCGGVSHKQLLLLADERNGRLEALWPLFVRKRRGVQVIHWIGQSEGMITDYMQPLVPAANRERAVRALLEFLLEHPEMWDVLDLSVPLWSGFFPALTKAAVVYGSPLGLQWKSGIMDHSSAISLPASFDELLAALGATTRSHVRQYLRGAEKAGAQFEILRGNEIAPALPELFRLNAERWKVFATPSTRMFLADVVDGVTRAGGTLFLANLRLEQQVIATALCYKDQGACYVHSAGVVRQSPKGFSPGTTLYARLVRSLIEEKCARLDLSPGLEEYKLRLGANVEPIFRFTAWHPKAAYGRWKALEALRETRQWITNA
jgi:CelD/BcsL family acetyltransferase involved in cellulose biosynthesis